FSSSFRSAFHDDKPSGPLSAFERAEGQQERQHREGNVKENVARIDEPALERAEMLAEAELAEHAAESVRHVLPELPDEVEEDEHDERDEKSDHLAVGEARDEKADGHRRRAEKHDAEVAGENGAEVDRAEPPDP